jgi:D-lactate dehydrogenase
MKVAVFGTKPYDRKFLEAASLEAGHELTFLEPRLSAETASLAEGHEAVCVFVHDKLSREALQTLHEGGTRFVALRCAGFNNVDLEAAKELGIGVARVPAYSPYAVAEHAVGLILSLNRKLHRAYNRAREGNFALEGLLGFDIHGKTVGVVGIGRIGHAFASIMRGFGCRVLVHDAFTTSDEFENVSLEQLLSESDIVSLHCPLTPETFHLINTQTIAQMKPGAMLINTSRGGLVDAVSVLEPLRSGHLSALGLDVYEEEDGVFYEDHAGAVWGDDTLMLLMAFPNVLITGHQAFFTREALKNIADTTMDNLSQWEKTGTCANSVSSD